MNSNLLVLSEKILSNLTGEVLESLPSTSIDALSSSYLSDGAFQDSFAIKSLALSNTRIEGTLAMESFGVSVTDDGGYHLTAPTVFRMVGQLVVIHGHWLLGLKQKSVEVWVKDHSMKHRKPLRDSQSIRISVAVSNPRVARSNLNMIGLTYLLTLDGGAVVGEATAFFDTSTLDVSTRERLFSVSIPAIRTIN
jgi:hypothetical protein